MLRANGGVAIAGKAGYAVSCVLAALILVGSGFAYYVKAQADSLGGSNVLAGGPSTGAMNILLMGLESRTYWSGQPLPRGLEDVMHVGSVGGDATNTLILIHIFAGGQKAVGFSIPRDDWVDMVGTNGYGGAQGKIDQAYGFAMADKMSQLAQQDPNMSSGERNFQGNEAGRLAAVETVEALTGVHIDHFAELNLDGFYQLANVFGGIEACLKQPTSDPGFSYANFRAGYQHLDAAQALAFVRQRHHLPNGDLDRTHRQQAALDYVIWKLEHQGVFSDLGQMSALMTVAKQYLITSGGWDLVQFAGEMKALTGKNLTFKTLPVITTDGKMNGQDVNLVDPATIKRVVQGAFYPPPAAGGSAKKPATPGKKSAPSLAPGETTVDVYNGLGGTPGLAGQLSQALASAGFMAGKVGNVAARSSTQVLYGTGASASAAKIAGYFNGVSATAGSSVAAGHVEVLLGTDATSVPPRLAAGSSSATSPASPVSGSPTSSADDGQAGGAVTVKANAKYGIPCVY